MPPPARHTDTSSVLGGRRWWTAALERTLDRIPLLEKEMLLLAQLVRPGWICLDVGAAGGTHLWLLSRLVGSTGHVIGVEPRRRSVAVLRRLQRWFAWRNVTVLRVALAETAGKARLLVPRMVRTEAHLVPGAVGLVASSSVVEEVSQWTLDGLVERVELPRVDLIKCDVEGAEELVFRGARETLRRWRPAVLVEIEQRHLARYGRRADAIPEMLRAHGYRMYRYHRGQLHPVTRIDAGDNDYVFLPDRHDGRPPQTAAG